MIAELLRTLAARADGWVNPSTGLGGKGDKTTVGWFAREGRLSDGELSSLYAENDIAATIVDSPVDEALRRGWTLDLGKGGEATQEAIEQKCKSLCVHEKVADAWRWGRLYGGGVLVIGALDGQVDLSLPLNEKGVRDIAYLNVLDRRFVTPYATNADPTSIAYGSVSQYLVTSPYGGRPVVIHESRMLRFDGVKPDAYTRQQLNGWSLSALQRPYAIMRMFGEGFQSTSVLLSDASQGVFKIAGLREAMSADPVAVRTRMGLIDEGRSVLRSILLDADGSEDYSRQPTSFAGISDVLDRIMMRLSAATGIPVSILMGRSPQGMNATGESDFRAYYDRIALMRQRDLHAPLERLLRLIALSVGYKGKDFELKFPPLWEMSDKERAELENTAATRDATYINAGVWYPEEVAIARADGDLSTEAVNIDVASRQASLKAEIDLALDPPETPTDAPEDTQANPNATEAPTGGDGEGPGSE